MGSIGYWGTIVTYAIRTGFSGALSTVSTFVAEVLTLTEEMTQCDPRDAWTTIPSIEKTEICGSFFWWSGMHSHVLACLNRLVHILPLVILSCDTVSRNLPRCIFFDQNKEGSNCGLSWSALAAAYSRRINSLKVAAAC